MGKINDIVFRFCQSKLEKEAAYALVFESYKKGKLLNPNFVGESFQTRDGLVTIIALRNGEVVGTVSSAHDKGKGSLPCDDLFPEEVNKMREKGFKIHEVTCLATKENQPLGLVLALTRESLHYEMQQGIDYGIVKVAPKHIKMYTDFMLFEPYGEEKEYRDVDPRFLPTRVVKLLRLDLRNHQAYKEQLKAKVSQAYQFYFPNG